MLSKSTDLPHEETFLDTYEENGSTHRHKNGHTQLFKQIEWLGREHNYLTSWSAPYLCLELTKIAISIN